MTPRPTPRRLAFLAWAALSCAPRQGGEFISVQLTWEPGVAARCFVVRATGEGRAPRATLPMLRGSGTGPLDVAIFRDDAPAEVMLEALGFADEGCVNPTQEHSEPLTASFVRRVADTGIELKVLVLPVVAGTDLDGDGVRTPEDCDDGNPLIRPGLAEACGDSFDNDCDGSIDCEDADCNRGTCAQARICVGLKCGEGACSNGVDDDGDGLLDCVDPDCDLQSCGVGGTCRTARCLAPTEARCDDGDDNDGNGLIDCADPQCNTRNCSDADGCTTGETCQGVLCTGAIARDCAAGLPVCLLNVGCDAGSCLARAVAAGTPCADACTQAGLCDGDGGCSGAPVTCAPAPGPCFGAGTCQRALDGGCFYPVLTGNTCSDGDACTTLDVCKADGGCGGARLTCMPTSQCLSWANTCTAGACDFVPRVGASCDGGSCSVAGACIPGGTSWPYVPSNFDPALTPAPDGGIVVDCVELLLDTQPVPASLVGLGCSPATLLPGPGTVVQLASGDALLLSASSFFIDAGAKFHVVGTRPVIFAISGDAIIAGDLLTAPRAGRPGSGADSNCAGATGQSATAGSGAGPGASGGAFGSAGAAGGPALPNGGTPPAATSPIGNPNLVPLQGGCSGGVGTGAGGGSRGRAGGGVQLSATGSLVVSGLIGAPGEGGGGAAIGSFGGGGAGSGGGVLLEASSLRLTTSGRVLALGGGGGEGSSTQSGNAGATGSRTTGAAALGGSGGSPRGGAGGAGASQTTGALEGNSGVVQAGGGGGGAGVGRVRFNVTGACTFISGALVSPQPSSPDGGCG